MSTARPTDNEALDPPFAEAPANHGGPPAVDRLSILERQVAQLAEQTTSRRPKKRDDRQVQMIVLGCVAFAWTLLFLWKTGDLRLASIGIAVTGFASGAALFSARPA